MKPYGSALEIIIYPKHQESAMGFLWRLSRANGYWATAAMLNKLGLNRIVQSRHIYTSHLSDIRKALEPYYGASVDQVIDHIASVIDAKPPRVPTNGLFIQELKSSSPRFCAHCIDQFGYVHASFEHALMTVCPIHETAVSECCSQCGESHQWGLMLSKQCQHCGALLNRSNAKRSIPAYQKRYMIDPAGDWLVPFTQNILMSARPIDAIHQSVRHLRLAPHDITRLLDGAWRLMSQVGKQRWEAVRAAHFRSLNGVNLQAIKAGTVRKNGTVKYLTDNGVSVDNVWPRWLTAQYSEAMLCQLVDTDTALALLGLTTTAQAGLSRQQWLQAKQYDANDSLAALGLLPMNRPRIITHYRYHVEQLNAVAEILPLADQVMIDEGEWIYADDSRFQACNATIIDLIIAVANDWLTGGRKANAGIVPLKVEATEFDQWLLWRLGRICAKPIKLIDARTMCSLSLRQVRVLVEHGVWQYVKGPELHLTYVAGSCVKEYILQQGYLSANHSTLAQ